MAMAVQGTSTNLVGIPSHSRKTQIPFPPLSILAVTEISFPPEMGQYEGQFDLTYQLGNFEAQKIPIQSVENCGFWFGTEQNKIEREQIFLQPGRQLLPSNLTTMFIASLSLFMLLLLFQETCQAATVAAAAGSQAVEHSCGEIPIIKPPFGLTTDPEICDGVKFNLSCESNTTVLYLRRERSPSSGRYYVKAINYNNATIRLVDDGVVSGDCSSFPAHPLSLEYNYNIYSKSDQHHYWYLSNYDDYNPLNRGLALINCDNPVVHSTTRRVALVETSPCIDFRSNSSSTTSTSYAVIGTVREAGLSDLPESCTLEMITGIISRDYYYNNDVTFQEIHRQLEHGFELKWIDDRCFWPNLQYCYAYRRPTPTIVAFVICRLLLSVLGTPVVIALLVYKWRTRHRSAYHGIEEFLQNQTHLAPVRYSYYHIKKITGGFKDKLGQGGFGSVYKAKLRGGDFAAVKLLHTTNNNKKKKSSKDEAGRRGQDFMNEVATIGRIHHANVVRLVGYCSEGSKQALVYEFMPNGSLDKHISRHTGASSLSLEQLYRISLGVARGIEYLHRGCAMQILHFDIKPHNILLDEDFTPKISDFGLARMNQAGRDSNIATLTAVRGTIGYMAPELFYKNIGGVSYKADVYSFGMLLLEIAGKSRDLNADDQSTVYFPSWVHNEVATAGAPIAVGEVTEEEDDIARKMVMVGLWCIQTSPVNRPPMNKVVEMLEGDLESLQLPPKPVLYTGEAARANEEEGSSSSSFVASEYTESVISNATSKYSS